MTAWFGALVADEIALPRLAPGAEDPLALARQRMVAEQLSCPGRDITNALVLAAMEKVPRHEFVPERLRYQAYQDRPRPIGHDQTISQPYIVAFMTEQLEPKPTDRVLEIGTGSGYRRISGEGLYGRDHRRLGEAGCGRPQAARLHQCVCARR
jgi:hypothetical protein